MLTTEQREIVLEALSDPEPLSVWEYDFINSLDDDRVLSLKQEMALEEIGNKYQ